MAVYPRPLSRRSDPLDIPFKPAKMLSPSRSASAPAPDAVERVRNEFVEMRGFSPTLDQAARLFQLPRDVCATVLTRLAAEGFVSRTADGRYRLTSSQ